jgi:hypothetical protein
MASTTSISVNLLHAHLVDISSGFDNVVHMLHAFARSHGASKYTKKLSSAVMDAQQLSFELDSHITRNANWVCAVHRFGDTGLALLEETYLLLVSMGNKMETESRGIHDSLLGVDERLKKACLLYLGEDVEEAEMISREYLKDRLTNWRVSRR